MMNRRGCCRRVIKPLMPRFPGGRGPCCFSGVARPRAAASRGFRARACTRAFPPAALPLAGGSSARACFFTPTNDRDFSPAFDAPGSEYSRREVIFALAPPSRHNDVWTRRFHDVIVVTSAGPFAFARSFNRSHST